MCSLECDYDIAIFSMKSRIYIGKYNLTHSHTRQRRVNMPIWYLYFKPKNELFSIKFGHISKIEGHNPISHFQSSFPFIVSETKVVIHND